MGYLTLNCPECRKRLVYVPLDGLTLYYRCSDHGAVILKPLVPVDHHDVGHRSVSRDALIQASATDAA